MRDFKREFRVTTSSLRIQVSVQSHSPAEPTLFLQPFANSSKIGRVDGKDNNCAAPNGSLSNQVRVQPFEMIWPLILPGVEQRSHPPMQRIYPRHVRSFVPIAMQASERKIAEIGCSAVLARNDVVNVKSGRVGARRHAAILTSILSA